jgi:hypothetical protein
MREGHELTSSPGHLIRKVSNLAFPLIALQAIRELREYLSEMETRCIARARELGASHQDIAESLGISRQGAYYKVKALARSRGHGSDPAPGSSNGDTGGSAEVTVIPDTLDVETRGAHRPR